MNRRDILCLLAAAAGSAAIATPAAASFGLDRPPIDAAARPELYLGEGARPLNYLMVLNSDGTLGLDLRHAVPQFDEDAADMSVLVDDLTRRPLRRLLDRARKVGTVYFFKSSLFVLPDEGDIPRTHASIVHRARSYEPLPAMKMVNLTHRPTNDELRQQPQIGEAYQTADRLILLIRPTPVDGLY
jgi:hypothetical protein